VSRGFSSTGGDHGSGALVPALPSSCCDLRELLTERDIEVGPVAVGRWVPRATPLVIGAGSMRPTSSPARWWGFSRVMYQFALLIGVPVCGICWLSAGGSPTRPCTAHEPR
jgi:hypothetical protein